MSESTIKNHDGAPMDIHPLIQEALEQGSDMVMVSANGCPQCKATERKSTSEGISIQVINGSTDDVDGSLITWVEQLTGGRSVPLVIDAANPDNFWVGFNPNKILDVASNHVAAA